MKILFITEKWYPEASGGEIYFKNLAHYLAKKGHKIFIITGKPVSNLNKEFKLMKSFPANFNQQNFSITTIIKRFIYSLMIFTMIRRIKKANIDIIHTIPPICSIISNFFGRVLKIPIVISILSYGYDNWYKITKSSIKDLFFKKIQEFSWKLKYKRIFSISNNFFVLADKLGIDKNRVKYIPNAVDSNLFKPKQSRIKKAKLGFKEKDFIIGYFGALEKTKRVDKLILAINKIKNHKNLKLLIIGEGTEKKTLQKLTSEFKLDNIKFFKKINHEIMPEFLSLIDILILPSTSEGFPGIILESLACGKPVITTRVGELNFILKHKVNGYFISETNLIDEISKAILELYENKDLYLNLSKNGLKLAKEYSWNSIYKKFEFNYSEILRSR